MKRRTFLDLAMTAGMGVVVSSEHHLATLTGARQKNILVLGGTNFLGPAIVEYALMRNHNVTLFNRGITRPHLFPEIEKLRGNREAENEDLTSIDGRHWDAVIDVWPEQSSLVQSTANLLADRTEYYFFCSSIATYTDFSNPNITESASTHVDDPGWYGGEKALAENIIEARFPNRFGIARCHSILGPRDNGTSYHYWLRRLALEDEVLAPGTGQDPFQYADVRDVARWIIDCVENVRVGTFNLCGPDYKLTLRAFLEASKEAIGSNARLTWVDPDFLREQQNVQSFSDMPLWAPLDEDEGFYQIDGSKALEAGVVYRPIAETARDAWKWYQSYFFKDMSFPSGGTGLSRDREIEILTAWKDQG